MKGTDAAPVTHPESKRKWTQWARDQLKDKLHFLIDLVDLEYKMKFRTEAEVDDAVTLLKEQFKKRGLRVLTEIDLQDIHHHFDMAYGPFKLIGVGNPGHAHMAIETDPDISVFLPLGVAVYEWDEETYVTAIKPTLLLPFFQPDPIQRVLRDAEWLLYRSIKEALPDAEELHDQPIIPPDMGIPAPMPTQAPSHHGRTHH